MVLIKSCCWPIFLEQRCALRTSQHASSSKSNEMDIVHIIGVYMFNDIDISFKIVLIYAEMWMSGDNIIYRTISHTALTRNVS